MNIEGISTSVITSERNKIERNNGSFEKLWDFVKQMNDDQLKANAKIQDVILGKSDDTHGALIALEKAELQMQLAVSVRDKLTQGYQQIINMHL